jgi:hypothetical protein
MHGRIAKEVIGLSARKDVEDYIQTQYDNFITEFGQLQADDALIHDIKSTVSVNGSGGQWPNVSELWNIVRYRVIMAVKEMPTLMGVVEGSTETWSSVDWQIYAQGLQDLVSIAAEPLVKSAQLHLRLLGMPYVLDVKYAPVRANQRMVDAQAEQIEIDNEKTKVFLGVITQDEMSMKLSGSAAVAPMDMEALGAVKPANQNPAGGAGGKVGGKGPSKAT